ncbi:hypothetical protein BST81_06485 [Leptolyngbya sp. 'hensonii']|uniref:HD domain-containing protein n=1 Tax=Leptolyngbya sp. 'hensonii' TaxID=1922337 RepID=UPI0009500D87|nr:HD domain-containing protein [Leptolyngbya sp. 'hensonii']OLP19387.1 hypothetical protein BST81_06485 [Leptolyngbya sp. 'hensonii']
MNHKRVIEIHNPHLQCGGTGYLIRDDLILTASHIVDCDEGAETFYDVRLIGEVEEGSLIWREKGARLCWKDRNFDLALLRLIGHRPRFLDQDDSDIKLGKLGGESLNAWGYGFPSVQIIQGRQNPEPLEGRLSKIAGLKEKQFRLQVTSPIPDNPEEWSGISGTSLFVGSLLVGVITETNKSFREKALWGTPISLLTENQEFCRLINPNQQRLELVDMKSPAESKGFMSSVKKPRFADNLVINTEDDKNQLLDFASKTIVNQNNQELNIIDFIARIPNRRIDRTRPIHSVVLRGGQGSGKTTFLSGLYSFLVSEYSPRFNQLQPLYINLTDYVGTDKPREYIKADVNNMASFISKSSSQNFLLMIDGLTSRSKDFSEFLLDKILEDIINDSEKVDAVIWSISDEFERTVESHLNEKNEFNSSHFQNDIIRVKSINVEGKEIKHFLKLFIILHNRIYNKETINRNLDLKASQLKKKLKNLNIREIDQFILSIVYLKIDDPSYEEIKSLARYIERYCQDKFGFKNLNDLEGIALLAYKIVIESFYSRSDLKPNYKSLCITNEDRKNNSWGFLIETKVIRDFLASWYVIHFIHNAGAGKGRYLDQKFRESIDNDIIGYDFPRSINIYSRELIDSLDPQKNFSRGIERILDYIHKTSEHSENLAQTENILFYFLGRCSNNEMTNNILDRARERIEDRLEKLKELDKIQEHSDFGNKKRIQLKTQYRTIAVSYMAVRAWPAKLIEDFLHQLIFDKEMRSIDRGYHRIYYGDEQPYKDLVPDCYCDSENSDWSNSFIALETRILEEFQRINDIYEQFQDYDESRSSGSEDSLEKFDVSLKLQHLIITLVSFTESRYNALKSNFITEEQIDFTRKVIHFILTYGQGILVDLEQYLKKIKLDLHIGRTSWNFIIDLYRLKWTPRSGWIKREIQEFFDFGRIESVADHTILTVWLAQFLLPTNIEQNSAYDREYNKAKVKDILTFHDFTEIYTGDLIPHYMDISQKNKAGLLNQMVLDYIRFQETYANLHGTNEIYLNCLDFAKSTLQSNELEKPSINSQIARDIDKFENLIQLHIYLIFYPNSISESVFNEFSTNLIDNIRSDVVKRLVRDFTEWFNHTAKEQKLFDLGSLPFRDHDLLELQNKINYPGSLQ